MLEIFDVREVAESEVRTLMTRPQVGAGSGVVDGVRQVVDDVRRRGDAAIVDAALRFEGSCPSEFAVSPEEIEVALSEVGSAAVESMRRAIANVERVHRAQLSREIIVESSRGVRITTVQRPIEVVGLYVPGGLAPLPSSLYMTAIPAAIAGCARRVVCSPPSQNGRIHPAVLAAAALSGINEVFAVGGAQAIAAMAYGTESIPKVDKIFGPGSTWVTTAKQLVALDPHGAAIDMQAGPSEVMVIADESARAEFVAADLLAQAEHDPSAMSVLLTTSKSLADRVRQLAISKVEELSRKKILESSLERSQIFVVADVGSAIRLANHFAPEHLIMQVDEANEWVSSIKTAGSVFLGEWTPEALGDYCTGSNHVLPTNGFARAVSGLSLTDFQRRMPIQEATPYGIAGLGPTAITLANLEGLDAHAYSVQVRLESLPHTSEDESISDHGVPVRKAIRELLPYQHAEWNPQLIRLHANESPVEPTFEGISFPPSNVYPEPQPKNLVEAFASAYGVPVESILLTRGSDEGIDLLTRAYCAPTADAVIVSPPTFGMYSTAAEINETAVFEAPISAELTLDIPLIEQGLDRGARIVWICSPNNPTGGIIPQEQVDAVLQSARGRSLVVVDEAYIEFSGSPSWVARVAQHPNLVVLRTLSKAHGLAGIRVGVVVAHQDVTNILRRMVPPYALTAPSIAMALAALSPSGLAATRARCNDVVNERLRLSSQLSRSSLVKRILPSAANFILVETDQPKEVMDRLVEVGIAARDVSGRGRLGGAVRISIGTATSNDAVIMALIDASERSNLKAMEASA